MTSESYSHISSKSLQASLSGKFGLAALNARGRAGSIAADDARNFNIVVGKLAELSIVQAKIFLLGANTDRKARNEVHEGEDDASHAKSISKAGDRVSKLVRELDPMAVDPATLNRARGTAAIKSSHVVSSENAREEVSDNTANAVLSKNIKRFVNTNKELDLGGKIAANTADHTKDNSSPWGDETSSRGNCDKTSNHTAAKANGAELLLKAIVEQAPGKASDACRNVGHHASHGGAHIGSKSTATVEAEPADPKESRTQDDMRNIVGTVWQAVHFVVASPLPQHESVGKSGSTGANVDGSTTSEIEAAQFKGPAIWVPGPVGKGVINDSSPNKEENDHGPHTGTISSTANGESRGDSGKHALVQAEQDLGKRRAANTRLSKDLSQANVVEVSNIRAAIGSEGEGVAPEEPLKSHDGYRYQCQEDEGQRRLAAGQAAVEKANTRNHEQDECRAGENPSKITVRIVLVRVIEHWVDALIGDPRHPSVLLRRAGRHG